MELPASNASFVPVINCTACGRDVDMAAMSEHRCAPSPSGSQLMVAPLSRIDSSNSLKSFRPPRPMLPKIDASGSFRPPMFKGELTPASSGHSSLVSPVSAGSGPRSPFPGTRKASMSTSRRPPSPELTNLDCAFPPFPTGKSKEKETKRRERSGTRRSETKRRSREGSRSSRHTAKIGPPLRAGTFHATSEETINDRASRPSTAAGSRKGSMNSSSESRNPSLDAIPHLPSVLERSFTAPVEHTSPLKIASTPPKSPTRSAPLEPLAFPIRDQSRRSLESLSFGLPSETQTTSDMAGLPQTSAFTAEPEPLYKSKRPPPLTNLASSEDILASGPNVKSPNAPQPPSAGILAKGLNRIFGRRPSVSPSQKRDIARQALSDEPESYFPEKTPNQPGLVSPTSNEPSSAALSPVALPDTLPGREESLKALEGWPLLAAEPLMVVVDTEKGEDPTKVVSLAETIETTSTVSATETGSSSNQGSRDNPGIRRASIDSASSYESEGFSEHTTSSRSSSPQTEGASLSFEKTYANLLKEPGAEMPPPLRPRAQEVPYDPPTELVSQQGRLSPTTENENNSGTTGSPILSAADNESTNSTTLLPESEASTFLLTTSVPLVSEEPKASDETETQSPIHSALTNAWLVPEKEAKPDFKAKATLPNKGICRGCSQVILATQKSVSSADGRLTGRYHKQCFVCSTCGTNFPTAEFYVHNDHPYCAHHYHELENSLCATCGKGIEGVYMETANVAGRGKEKHHPECLKCTTCRVRLDHDYFELSGKVYCERDAFRLATLPKTHDNVPSRPSPLIREYISSGDPGLVKGRNFPERRITRLMSMT